MRIPRTLRESMRNAERIAEELPKLIQPSNEDYDIVNLLYHIRRLQRRDNQVRKQLK